MTTVRVCAVDDFPALGVRWRDLEQRAAGSFFQSWTWVGCLVAERFPDPIVVEATEAGRTVALALFNRVRRWIGPAVLHLNENGTSELDCPYVEQNGVLAEAGREEDLTALCLGAVLSSYDVVLSGVGEASLGAVRRVSGLLVIERTQRSPFVDLGRLRAAGTDYLAERSADTRQQIRRSDRFYERDGAVVVQRADTVAAAHAMLDEMAALHQAAWTARGQPGSFARPFFRRFHRDLVATGMPRGEIALLRVQSGNAPIGILYNFVYRGRMLAYQSGFAYQEAESRTRPGLSCHYQAIRLAMAQGMDIYDFLAGNDRYKRSLADESHQQIWARAGSRRSVRLLLSRGRDLLRDARPALWLDRLQSR